MRVNAQDSSFAFRPAPHRPGRCGVILAPGNAGWSPNAGSLPNAGWSPRGAIPGLPVCLTPVKQTGLRRCRTTTYDAPLAKLPMPNLPVMRARFTITPITSLCNVWLRLRQAHESMQAYARVASGLSTDVEFHERGFVESVPKVANGGTRRNLVNRFGSRPASNVEMPKSKPLPRRKPTAGQRLPDPPGYGTRIGWLRYGVPGRPCESWAQSQDGRRWCKKPTDACNARHSPTGTNAGPAPYVRRQPERVPTCTWLFTAWFTRRATPR